MREVDAVEAAGGMTTQDGSRRRTRGGVFFALVYERLGAKRAKSLRWRAARRFEEGMARRFVQLIALASSATPAGTAATREAAAPAPSAASAGPAPRQEPPAVEVLVVRRRPATATSTEKPGPSKPRGGR